MSIELHALLKKDRLPDRQRWQQSIVAVGLPLELDPTLDLARDTGFSPCTLAGEKSGFEIYPGDAREIVSSYPRLAPLASDRDYVISFRWGGDPKECACVLGAAAALVKDFGAAAYYPDDDIVYDFERLVSEARQCL